MGTRKIKAEGVISFGGFYWGSAYVVERTPPHSVLQDAKLIADNLLSRGMYKHASYHGLHVERERIVFGKTIKDYIPCPVGTCHSCDVVVVCNGCGHEKHAHLHPP
jgi:hypothetical protein